MFIYLTNASNPPTPETRPENLKAQTAETTNFCTSKRNSFATFVAAIKPARNIGSAINRVYRRYASRRGSWKVFEGNREECRLVSGCWCWDGHFGVGDMMFEFMFTSSHKSDIHSDGVGR